MSDENKSVREMENERLAREKNILDELKYKENVQKLLDLRKQPAFTHIALGIVDLILIFVVIYGTKHYVYAGFPGFVPWLVAGIFAVMLCIRAYNAYLALNGRPTIEPKSDESEKNGQDK